MYNKIDMLFIPCTSNCRTHLSKTKKKIKIHSFIA